LKPWPLIVELAIKHVDYPVRELLVYQRVSKYGDFIVI
jgi:hypothetical protein